MKQGLTMSILIGCKFIETPVEVQILQYSDELNIEMGAFIWKLCYQIIQFAVNFRKAISFRNLTSSC